MTFLDRANCGDTVAAVVGASTFALALHTPKLCMMCSVLKGGEGGGDGRSKKSFASGWLSFLSDYRDLDRDPFQHQQECPSPPALPAHYFDACMIRHSISCS